MREGMRAGTLADPAERSGAGMTLQSFPKSKQGGWPWYRQPLLWVAPSVGPALSGLTPEEGCSLPFPAAEGLAAPGV